MTVTFDAAARAALERGAFVRVSLPSAVVVRGAGAPVRSVLVGRSQGGWRAYANVCKHRAIPLDFGADSAMSDDGAYLLCHQHGARYRTDDGVCVGGPCAGEALVSMPVEEVEPWTIALAIEPAAP